VLVNAQKNSFHETNMVDPVIFVQKMYSMYPKELVHLDWDKTRPFTFLFAVILSAQCTDARVNIVTPVLFEEFPDLESFVARPVEELEQVIKSTGFYRNKAKNLKACAERLLLVHAGKIPTSMEEMVALGGVGRKTANVVLHVLYGLNAGFVVDTHIKRISYRVGMTEHASPVKIERDLVALMPQNVWGSMAHKMVQFGRDVCNARTPKCSLCVYGSVCPRNGVERSA
jgi:endonuclease-3